MMNSDFEAYEPTGFWTLAWELHKALYIYNLTLFYVYFILNSAET